MNTSKRSFRQQMLVALEQITSQERRRQEAAVLEHLIALDRWHQAQHIALTKPMAVEFSLTGIVQAAWAAGKKVYVPVMQPHRQLQFVHWTVDTRFEKNAFGVEEPIERQEARLLEEMDLVIVPGLAFSKQGDRLGFGGGYYDRALAGIQVPTVSVAYQRCVFDEVRWDVESFDVPIDTIITAEGVW